MDSKVFELRMRGHSFAEIAYALKRNVEDVEREVQHVTDNFEVETDKFLKYLERHCLFEGQRNVVELAKGGTKRLDDSDILSVEYLRLAFDIRMERLELYKQGKGIKAQIDIPPQVLSDG